MSADHFSQDEKRHLSKKARYVPTLRPPSEPPSNPPPRSSAFSTTSHGLAINQPSKTTKPRGPRESATSGIAKPAQGLSLGSTYRNGKDPVHAIIVEYGEPTHWVQVREAEARFRKKGDRGGSEPPDPRKYGRLPESPAQVSSGLDVNRRSMSGKEFWGRLAEAWERSSWEERRWKSVGTRLCEERSWEKAMEEEREEIELLRRIHEVKELGG